MGWKKYTGWLFVLPGFLGVAVFYLIPFLDVIRRSFTQAVGGRFVGLANYQMVFENQAFLLAAKNTLRFAAVCLPLLLVISLGIAVFLQRLETWSGFLKGAYLVPLAIPAASVVLLWKLLFDGRGILNGLLAAAGQPGIDWMNTGASFGVLVFSYIWKNLGYDVVLWIAGLSMVPKQVYEAARVDGAGECRCFFYITLPGIRPAAFTIVVISFLNSFKVFREAYLVAGNYPQDDIYLLQHLFHNWFRELSVDKMASGAVTMAAVIFLLVCLLQKSWDKK
ncbi:MAG: sugar ABC transporter permease [Lachnospiraceae bacterium]|jgi:multiple sugar transport system permease protein|nr:sugar ABC transporter permease [Lachnospiraceae bacterium]